MELHVTQHAISRYQERVRPVSTEDAILALTSPFILKAAQFGAKYVRLHAGQHVVIEDGCVKQKAHMPRIIFSSDF